MVNTENYVALHYLLDNIFIRFSSKLYRQIVDSPIGTYCAPILQIFFFAFDFMRKTSFCFFLTIISLILLKRSALL